MMLPPPSRPQQPPRSPTHPAVVLQEAAATRARVACLRRRLEELRALNADRQQRAAALQERVTEAEVRADRERREKAPHLQLQLFSVGVRPDGCVDRPSRALAPVQGCRWPQRFTETGHVTCGLSYPIKPLLLLQARTHNVASQLAVLRGRRDELAAQLAATPQPAASAHVVRKLQAAEERLGVVTQVQVRSRAACLVLAAAGSTCWAVLFLI